MTNEEIKTLFEEKIKTNTMRNVWSDNRFYKEGEQSFIYKWFNQLNEDQICFYLKKDHTILSIIENQSDHICEFAICCDYESIRFIKNQKNHLCKLAISKNATMIRFVKNQTVDLCLLSLEIYMPNYKHIRIVPNPDYETTLKNLYEKKAILDLLK